MTKTILKIEGMACAMCEAHVNDALRRALPVKKVSASHRRGEAELITDSPLDPQQIFTALNGTGYRVLNVREEPYEKKGFSLFRR